MSDIAIRDLVALVDASQLSGSKEFAESLISQFQRKQTLSPKQWYWVNRLVDESHAKAKSSQAPQVNAQAMIAMFEKVGAKIKHPRITATLNDLSVMFHLAGPRAKEPGSITMVIAASTYRLWAGRISVDGTVTISRNIEDAQKQTILQLVQDFSVDPLGAAARSGQVTGKCCFCNRKLSDEHSLHSGYGAVCARRYGVGHKAAQKYDKTERLLDFVEMPNGRWRVRNHFVQWLAAINGRHVWVGAGKHVLEFDTQQEAKTTAAMLELKV